MDDKFFSQTKSRLHRWLKVFGRREAAIYMVGDRIEAHRTVYGLDIPSSAIRVGR